MSDESRPVLTVENLSYRIPGGPFLAQGLSFTILPREILWITGANGSGKSTLLKTLLGQHPKASGKINFHVPTAEIEYLPQLQNLHFHIPSTLRDIIEVALSRRPSEQEILETGLIEEEQLERPWNGASGGEKKRALLARILLRKPKLILLDEPMNHLDLKSKLQVLSSLRKFLERNESSLIWISHTDGMEDEMQPFRLKSLHLGSPLEVAPLEMTIE
ncbi:MAG: ABC transporter ATP-binding protein [Cryobacterium sp.]|nr:ABC transporter ATP-binding protein [Oligoflexia bacterium]